MKTKTLNIRPLLQHAKVSMLSTAKLPLAALLLDIACVLEPVNGRVQNGNDRNRSSHSLARTKSRIIGKFDRGNLSTESQAEWTRTLGQSGDLSPWFVRGSIWIMCATKNAPIVYLYEKC